MGFILAAAGSAVGLGNIWGFPTYTARNGGAAFLIVYLVLVFVVCLPVILLEIAIGRRTQRNPVGALKMLAPGTSWNLVGKMGVFCGIMILSFYIVIAGWVFGYFLECVTGGLERLASEGEFGRFVGSPWKNLLYMGAFMAATVAIVLGGVRGGIEKWARILMPTLLVMLFALIAYVLTREHALTGLRFYLVPDFSKLTAQVLNSALSQAFFSLSLGMGALITYGSYMSKKDNILSSGFIVALVDSFIAFSAGLLIIPAIFTLGPNVDAGNLAQGPGLIFVVLPQVFMNMAGQVGYTFASFLASFFFLLICFAALTSTISLLEVPTAYVVDEKGIRRKKAALITAGVVALIGLGSLLANGASSFFSQFITYPSGKETDFMTLIGDVFFETLLPVGGCLLTAFTAFIWKTGNFSKEIAQGYPEYAGSILEKWFSGIIYLVPFVTFFIFINTVLQKYFDIQLF